MDDDFAMKQILVSLAVGKALIDIDSRRYSEVSRHLGERYGISLADCYQNPVHLRESLKELYGNSYRFIVESIREKLSDFPDHPEVSQFLDLLSE